MELVATLAGSSLPGRIAPKVWPAVFTIAAVDIASVLRLRLVGDAKCGGRAREEDLDLVVSEGETTTDDFGAGEEVRGGEMAGTTLAREGEVFVGREV